MSVHRFERVEHQRRSHAEIPSVSEAGECALGTLVNLNVIQVFPGQTWVNYDQGTICSLISFLFRPAKLEEIILIMILEITLFGPFYSVSLLISVKG